MRRDSNDPPTTKAQRYRPDDKAWAKAQVVELVAGCQLNIKLVQAGLWPTLLCDMKNIGDIAAYATFVKGLNDTYQLAKDIRNKHSE